MRRILIVDDSATMRRMVAAAQAAGKTYAVIQNRRYDPHIRRLRQFLDSGAIGDVTTVHCDFFIGAHFGGFRDHMQHVLLLDMAIHTFDAARLISGAPAELNGSAPRFTRRWGIKTCLWQIVKAEKILRS